MGVRRSFSRGQRRRHFAYHFQVPVDAMQMNVHKKVYPFYTTKNAPCYGNSHKHTFRRQQ